MSAVSAVLQRVFVVRFYSANTGFFLVIFLVCFGLMEPYATFLFHLELMRRAAHSPQLIALMTGLFMLYWIKCYSFFRKTLALPGYSFIMEVASLPKPRRYRLALGITAGFLAPALLYLMATVMACITQNGVAAALILLAVQGFAVVALAAGIMQQIPANPEEKNQGIFSRIMAPFSSFSTWLVGLPAAWLLHRQKVQLLAIKCGSLLLLQVFVFINHDRFVAEFSYYILMLLVALHAPLARGLFSFTEQNRWLRNLPVPLAKRYAAYVIPAFVLFVPEMLYLLLHAHSISLPYKRAVVFYLLQAALWLWLLSVQYVASGSAERFTLVVAGTLSGTILCLTFVPADLLAVIFLVLGVLSFWVWYWLCEPKVEA